MALAVELQKSYIVSFILEIFSHILNIEQGQSCNKYPNNIIIFVTLLFDKSFDKKNVKSKSQLLNKLPVNIKEDYESYNPMFQCIKTYLVYRNNDLSTAETKVGKTIG